MHLASAGAAAPAPLSSAATAPVGAAGASGSAALAPVADSGALFMPVTVAVAWTLVRQRAGLKPRVIQEAREHVLRSLPPDCDVDLAEFLTPELVHDWIGRLKHRRYRRLEPPPEGPWPPLHAAQRALMSEVANDRYELHVLRWHYGEREPLDALARQKANELRRLEAARGRLRERVRALTVAAIGEGQEWEAARLDHLLRRLANLAIPGGPGPMGLLSPAGTAHAKRCPRTARAIRLVTHKGLDPSLLLCPADQPPVPPGAAGVLALLLHPDARRYGKRLERLIGAHAIAVGDDAWLVPEDKLGAVVPALVDACLDGAPSRHFLRGALVRDAGRWSHQVLLGPLPLRAVEAARGRPWGELDGVTELPLPRPPPPSAARWWASAAGLVAAAAAAALLALQPAGAGPRSPVEANFSAGIGVVDARFDVPDLATVDVLALRQGQLHVVHRGAMAAKGVWATGEGDYVLRVQGELAGLVVSDGGVDDLDALIAQANATGRPMGSLRGLLRAAHPRAELAAGGAASLLGAY
ncbi:MAG: hypothetical protein JNM72_27730 [Deltaproteobacteria bacterium]|nr:hypothetical protein [Deltaproteobacteria bacterium]